MLCPTCGKNLNKIDVTTRQGGRFQVDHCGYCGGTWFDPYEINRIPFHEVVSLAGLTVLPSKNLQKTSAHLCPNDHLPLDNFQGEAVPSNVKLLWCKRCLGVWATQKDLLEFKKHQEDIISFYDQGNKFFPALSVVFVPALTFLFLLATTFTTITSLQQKKDERIFAESQISYVSFAPVSENSVILSFNTASAVSSSILFGPSTFEMSELTISHQPKTQHSIVINELDPEITYLYQLKLKDGLGKPYITELKTFSVK